MQDRHLNVVIVMCLTFLASVCLAILAFKNVTETSSVQLSMIANSVASGLVGFIARGNAKSTNPADPANPEQKPEEKPDVK